MKKHMTLAIVGLVGLSTLGWHILMPSEVPSMQGMSRSETLANPYRSVSVIVWKVDSRDTQVEARLETLNVPLKDAAADLPLSRLVISNATTKEVIHQQNVDDRPLSMYVRDVNGDSFSELILTWSKGAVAERLEILSVAATQVQVALDKSYRLDAALIRLADETVDVLVTTGDSGNGPFYTTRYVWRGGRYQAVGRLPYEKLTATIKHLFANSRRR